MRSVARASLGPCYWRWSQGGFCFWLSARNPFAFYADIYRGGVTLDAWQDSVMRMAPLLLIAAGLIVIFKANIWNLGNDGQFLLAGAVIAGLGPTLDAAPATGSTLLLLFLIAGRVGGLDGHSRAVEGVLRVNEIITTLMMSFIGINLANILIKGPFQDLVDGAPDQASSPSTTCCRASRAPASTSACWSPSAAILIIHYVLTRTSFGLRLQVLGRQRRARRCTSGINVPRLIVTAF